MKKNNALEVLLIASDDKTKAEHWEYDVERVIFELDRQVDGLSSRADSFDYLVSIASGVLCSLLDIFWNGEFDLVRGRSFGSDTIEAFVKKMAKILGCESDDLKKSIKFLEEKFPIPSDGNTPDFGGGLQHHLRDFSHHPTVVGLMFSLMTQFSGKSYGTDKNGVWMIAEVPKASRTFIGKDPAEKIIYGTFIWFFHLVSDMAGSSSTAGLSGGTGIPGPILSMAKELSVLPLFKDMQVRGEGISVFLAKLFHGTWFARRDENGKIIKESIVRFDLRGELGLMEELGHQVVPVIANESMVRIFYFIRCLTTEIDEKKINTLLKLSTIDWKNIKPVHSPTLSRMITIATGVFTTLDVAEAVAMQKFFVAVNYVGVGRFAVALGDEMVWMLKRRNVKQIRKMYEDIKYYTYAHTDQKIYERIQKAMDGCKLGLTERQTMDGSQLGLIENQTMDGNKLGLTEKQTEILYNLEYYKVLNDINSTKPSLGNNKMIKLKMEWLREWQDYMTSGYASFLQIENAVLHWYDLEELMEHIKRNNPSGTWFRLVLLEAMVFEPYYPLNLEKDKKGNQVPSKKYKEIHNILTGYKRAEGDSYLEKNFADLFCGKGYVKRIRKCYDKMLRELNEVLKTAITSLSIAAGVVITTVVAAGAFAPAIAVALVGSNFTGLSGAALTSACLAYFGGGAVAAGGLGMAGGTMVIVGGGAVLGLGVGGGVGGITGAIRLMGKKNTILQSAKLLVSVREIFLNDEQDLVYSNTIYEQYIENIVKIEKELVEVKLREETADAEGKKRLKAEIKEMEESIYAMKIAMKSMKKFISSYEIGIGYEKLIEMK